MSESSTPSTSGHAADASQHSGVDGVARRAVLGMGLAGLLGVTVGGATASAVTRALSDVSSGFDPKDMVPFYGEHQAGIETALQAYSTLVAFDVRADQDRDAVARLMRLWTADAARLTQGQPALADATPVLAESPARLTVTIGLGLGAFRHAGVENRWPHQPLPAFAIDALRPEWSDGDIVLQVGGNDAVSVAHAVRELAKGAAPFTTVRWTQRGFHSATELAAGHTPRNLMGQVDGTVNPAAGTAEFDTVVWRPDGSTSMVIRRIAMALPTWESLNPAAQEKVIGRTLATGAPIGGVRESDTPDFEASDHHGLLIPMDAHMRRARFAGASLHRRPFSYDDGMAPDGTPDAGLIFIAHQADVRQFITVQQALSELDSLNTWTTPIGSTLVHVPAGVAPGGWIGQEILG